MKRPIPGRSPLAARLAGFRKIGFAVSAMSGVVNILALSGSFYMLQVYDRVLTSHSVPTLVALTVLVVGLYAAQGVIDVIRGHVLVLVAGRVEQRLSGPAHEALLRLPLFGSSTTAAVQPIRDIEAIRAFLVSQGPIAILDLPWMPVYLMFVTVLSPWLGLLTLVGILMLLGLTLLTDHMTKGLNRDAAQAGIQRFALADANARNAEAVRAMGLGPRLSARYHGVNGRYLQLQARSSEIGGGLAGISKVMRMFLQSAVLGLGAWLTIRGELTAGAIIAASIASARALAPIELAVAHWKALVMARQSWSRLEATLASLPVVEQPLALPPPTRSLALEAIAVAVPGTQRLVLQNVTLALEAGQGLGVVGPSGSGKSTLSRAITGVWPLARGAVRIDGAALDQWTPETLGAHIGYLPQAVELFDGTIAENIGRFETPMDNTAIIAAAKAAGVHALILRLPHGYETALGPNGTALSAGQRQRIALARALYRDPFLVVLDEPNSNLDAEGDAALTAAIQGVRKRGGIVVVIAHRSSALVAVDMVAAIVNGTLAGFGPRDEVLRKLQPPPNRARGTS